MSERTADDEMAAGAARWDTRAVTPAGLADAPDAPESVRWPMGAGDTGLLSFRSPTVAFDGHRFGAAMLPILYLAARARRGDAVAAELLNAFAVKVRDADGRRYWPPGGGEAGEADAPAVRGSGS